MNRVLKRGFGWGSVVLVIALLPGVTGCFRAHAPESQKSSTTELPGESHWSSSVSDSTVGSSEAGGEADLSLSDGNSPVPAGDFGAAEKPVPLVSAGDDSDTVLPPAATGPEIRREPSDLNELITFFLPAAANSGLRKDLRPRRNGNRFTLILPEGVSGSRFVSSIRLSPYASVSPKSGVPVDFNRGNTLFRVTSESGIPADYRVNLFREWEVTNSDLERALSYGTFGYRKDFEDVIVTGQSFTPSASTAVESVAFSFFGPFRNSDEAAVDVVLGMDVVDISKPGSEVVLQSVIHKVNRSFNGGQVTLPLRRLEYLESGKEYCMMLYIVGAADNLCYNNLKGNPEDPVAGGSKYTARLRGGRTEKQWRYFSSDEGWDLWMQVKGGIR